MNEQLELWSDEPACWGMPNEEGVIIDVITPEEHTREEGSYTVPLYTQPKREWISLTEEEISESFTKNTLREMYLAIEAKLREKNER